MNTLKTKFIKLHYNGTTRFEKYVTAHCIDFFAFEDYSTPPSWFYDEEKDIDIYDPGFESYCWSFCLKTGGYGFYSPSFNTKEEAAQWLEDNLGEYI